MFRRRNRGPRRTGLPTSSNGASSLHLRWELDRALEAAAVTLTVTEVPTVDRLYFWAMQTDFTDARGNPAGGAHIGLQWHPAYPGHTAVNWGGYRHGGGELTGSGSPLASAAGNPNTRDYRWEPLRAYRLGVRPVRPGEPPLDPPPPGHMQAWRASVTDVESGVETVIRDLHVPATSIRGVTVWSEVFARCDDPPSSVLWSDPTTTTPAGETLSPARAQVNYQSERDGGCANTDSHPVDDPFPGLAQSTNTGRSTPQGSFIAWHRNPARGEN